MECLDLGSVKSLPLGNPSNTSRTRRNRASQIGNMSRSFEKSRCSERTATLLEVFSTCFLTEDPHSRYRAFGQVLWSRRFPGSPLGEHHESSGKDRNFTQAAMADDSSINGDRTVEEVADILPDTRRRNSASQDRTDVIL